MIQPLIKFAPDMAQVIHGVSKSSKLALYNLPLSIQILVINIFITFIGFIFLIMFNFFMVQNDESIFKKKNNSKQNLITIQNFLEKNSIIRVPLFDVICKGENTNGCKENKNQSIDLSEPVLEPKITQQFIMNNYLNSNFNIRIYNDEWIRLVDTLDVYDLSFVQESDLKENNANNNNNFHFIKSFSQNYLAIFENYQDYLIKKKYENKMTIKKSDIFYVSEIIKNKNFIEYVVVDKEENIYQYIIAPVINNNKVYGVIILDYLITDQRSDLGLISLNIFVFFVLFVIIMILLSLVFSRSLVSPIKKLSKLTILERERVSDRKIFYPNRADEIGVLANEIQKMSAGLKLQIEQLEKFSADVSHELKNPLTSLQSGMELIIKDNISNQNKNLLINNMQNDLRRMNQLITDISKFTRLKAEIELEKNEYININNFIDRIPKFFVDNNKQIKFVIDKIKDNKFIVANKNKLIQVFVNLIENSISLSPNKSKILIKLEQKEKDKIIIKIYDQGRGVNLSDREKIFDRFYSDRQDDVKNHTGLGLSIAREIINHMEGTLVLNKSEITSYSGACFLIILPVRQNH